VRVRVADTSSVRVTDANGLCVADCDSHANININTNANANGDRHTNTYPVCKLRGPAHVSGGAGIHRYRMSSRPANWGQLGRWPLLSRPRPHSGQW